MDFMVPVVVEMIIVVNPGGPGNWPKDHVRRRVFALGYLGRETLALVADDSGKLQWLASEFWSVPSESR